MPFMKWNHWAVIILGVWLVLSPWLLGYAEFNLVAWNSVAVGALIIVFTFWNTLPPSISDSGKSNQINNNEVG
jgi:hypothetical protein